MQRVEVCDVRQRWATAIERAVALLRTGQIVAYPTDTLYALGAAANDARAVRAVMALKERPTDKALPIIAADLEQVAAHVGSLPPLGLRLAQRLWPGPLTLVMTASRPLAPGIVAPDGSVAVRVPASDVARALAAAVERPVTSTSANKASGSPAESADEVTRVFGTTVALVLDGGPAPAVAPSTIVDIRGTAPQLLREGALTWGHVLESLE
ncbi:MAG: threonylcarbamoyl-AMP synthase [Luteitalea sp.]|nr:threonylcarbamoyl-AMP synthase [Luteitalea sp.]